ncbi:TPA: WYL domain-containing protein [Klebsiella aerogenes]|nr:WYL domain-containing protein [Klebsiella aerogenes]HBY1540393.1 WYL domain-containing protein [Klebsiella aerogenes]HBY1604086.1 WYL domain-containing protein [Klebsiella aerogenes]HBY1640986.1 WYL domain-containing protein [Klebsiella aerogenes]
MATATWAIANGDKDLSRHEAYRSNLDYQRLRRWCGESRKIVIVYQDRNGVETQRTVWPFMMGYVTGASVVIAWCEMREDFRIFRDERIKVVEFCKMQYPVRTAVLRRDWMQRQVLLAVQTGSQK